ncbi:MAG: acyltransferase domain-containing protein [Anaerolineae bacterium]|nr:acyltransferase domain-containing protein [Anaerolineae bacterium]
MAPRPKKTDGTTFATLGEHPVAIIGMGAIFPEARNLSAYWQLIFDEVDCLKDIPPSRWQIDDYYDPDPAARDRSYSKRGAFIPDIEFNPMEFGLPPNMIEATDVSQLLSLVVAKEALLDAGYFYADESILDRTGVILGMVGIASKSSVSLSARLQYPIWQRALNSVGIDGEAAEKIIERIQAHYADWSEHSFPGALANIVAGRITNRFNLGATNCTIDAACGSSLAAVQMAISELVQGKADLMITGGVDIDNTILTYLCFSKTPALTPGEKVRTFDEASDGMLPGEGIGMLVLKRLADAERDGDRIYAVIRGMGSSSDGRYKSIYAPRSEGQAKALRRAYAEAGFPPQTVGLIEAHGTGTPAGDPAEFAGLKQVFTPEGEPRPLIALGSVKSQIGHTKAAAGAAGLIKTALALHQKVLPPTVNVEKPSSKLGLEDSLFYINSETRPWMRRTADLPRRAGVSAFGFGGTNFHVVLEEYESEWTHACRLQPGAATVLLHAPTPQGLREACEAMKTRLLAPDGERALQDAARHGQADTIPTADARLGFAAVSAAEAVAFLDLAMDNVMKNAAVEAWEHPRGLFYRRSAMETGGKVVALFPGQGSQYVNMARELAVQYPPAREMFALANHLRQAAGEASLTDMLFPVPAFSHAAEEAQKAALTLTENAQPAIGAVSAAMYRLLCQAGLAVDFTAGHSFGEWTALWAAGVLDDETFLRLAIARGQAMRAAPGADHGTMLAVKGDAGAILKAVETMEGVTAANINSHQQVVLAGSQQAIGRAMTSLADQGFAVVPLAVSAAFHSPLVAHAQQPFAEVIAQANFRAPRLPVYSNNTAQPHADDPAALQQQMSGHMLSAVNFRDEIENIHTAGGRIFIEIGPRSTLTNLVKNILDGKECTVIAVNPNHRQDSDLQLRQAYVQLKVLGMALGLLDPWQRVWDGGANPASSKVNVTLNGGVYRSEKSLAQIDALMNDGYQMKKVEQPMETQQANQTTPSNTGQQQAQPGNGNGNGNGFNASGNVNVYPAANGHSAELHGQYLQAAQEFNRALTALTQVEQDLVRLGNHNGNHKHLEHVLQRITRLMDHQEAMLAIHAGMLTGQAVQAPPPVPVVQPQAVAAPVQAAAAAPVPVVVAEAPVPAAPAQASGIADLLLAVVADKTGYPADTLELGMGMEADLGIDSIKRVEILGAMQESLPGITNIDMEALGNLVTLQDVVGFMEELNTGVDTKKA